ncbi:MAG: hypothetical protein EBV92_04070, partial [Betaproteobacteria bacterium]|nr:hypothetical protein [Betaproteobacteria bacterium]
MTFWVAQTSRIGGRELNEDRSAYCYTAQSVLLLVADGPQWREGLHLALVQEGYRVQQQPLPMRLQLLSAQAELVQPPDLLILNLPTQRWNLGGTVQQLERLRRRDLSTLLLMLPDGADEQARVHAIEHLFVDGMVYAPDRAFAEKMINQCAVFPKGSKDDLVDTMSQALRYLRDHGLALRREE